jgi:hypothetical protein
MDLAGVSEAETCRRSPSEVKDLRRDLVDLVGIEPTTSSMPWNCRKCKLLTAKGQKIGYAGKNRKNSRF